MSKRTPDQSYHLALERIDRMDHTVSQSAAALFALAGDLQDRDASGVVVTALERASEKGRSIVRVRVEDRSAPYWTPPWQAVTYTLLPDDHYVAESFRFEGVGPDGETLRTDLEYDRYEGIPVLRRLHSASRSTEGAHRTIERQFGPIPEEAFAPERFLDGPQVTMAADPDPFADEPNRLMRWFWLPFAAGVICLLVGAGLRLGAWHSRSRLADGSGVVMPAEPGGESQ